jgi:DNA polymerase-3 subunit delta
MKALRPALQDKQFEPAYYLYGEDEYLKEEALRHLIDAAVDPATRDFNLDVRRGPDLDAESLASLTSMPPMMAERRVVVVRDVGSLNKDARAALDAYIEKPAPEVVVILTSLSDDKPEKSLQSRTVAVDCAPLSGALVPKWIVSRVEKTLKTTIAPEAVELLIDSIGSDLSQLATELDKLVAYCGGKPIDEAAVAAIVGMNREESPGMLLDAVAARDVSRALSLLPGVLRQPKTSGVQLVMALTTQTLALSISRARNVPAARATGEFWSILKAGGHNYAMRAWGEATSAWARVHGKWSAADLDHALTVLLNADVALKQSRVSNEDQILASAILQICAGSNRAAA